MTFELHCVEEFKVQYLSFFGGFCQVGVSDGVQIGLDVLSLALLIWKFTSISFKSYKSFSCVIVFCHVGGCDSAKRP